MLSMALDFTLETSSFAFQGVDMSIATGWGGGSFLQGVAGFSVNPAALYSVEGKQVVAGGTSLYGDSFVFYGGFVDKLWGVYFKAYGITGIPFTTLPYDTNQDGVIDENDMSAFNRPIVSSYKTMWNMQLKGAMARRIAGVKAGVSLSLVGSFVDEYFGGGLLVDTGIMGQTSIFDWSLVLKGLPNLFYWNTGRFEFGIPGVSVEVSREYNLLKGTYAFSVRPFLNVDSSYGVSAGLFAHKKWFSLVMSYSDLGFGVGASFNYSRFHISYVLTLWDIGASHWFSVGFKL